MQHNYQTLEKLIKRVIQRLSMYQGTSVQIYAEDRILQMILDHYNLVINSYPWSCLSFWKEYTLAGSRGEVLENVKEDFTSYADIIAIVPKDAPSYSLKRVQSSTPVSEIEGTSPAYYTFNVENPEKIFKVLPETAIGNILVHAKGTLDTNRTVHPREIIPFDSDYLVYAVCADYLADDGNSQIQLQKFSQMRDSRLMTLKVIDNSGITDYNDEVSLSSLNAWR